MNSLTGGSVAALVSVVLSAFIGTGGVGYVFLQWLLKRHDSETQANAARVLTDTGAVLIAELHKEKQEMRAEMLSIKDEVRIFRKTVQLFVEAVEEVIPLLRADHIELEHLRSTMREVRSRL